MSRDMRLNYYPHLTCVIFNFTGDYTRPWASIEFATFTKPAMLAPRT